VKKALIMLGSIAALLVLIDRVQGWWWETIGPYGVAKIGEAEG
jgi:hypothetical protein